MTVPNDPNEVSRTQSGVSGDPMIESHDRVQEFKQEIADMRVRDPATSRDRIWLRVGVVLMVLGLVVAVIAYPLSHGTTNPLAQRDALALGLGGIAATVVGAALFLRYSIAGFLRFWLARLSYEQQAQTDRVIEKLGE
jgi:hypothetical protein